MKKIILLIVLVLLTGCFRLDTSNNEEIIDNALNSKSELYNQYRSGYKYYLPKNMKISRNRNYNEHITSSGFDYYLYVDIVSYYKNIKNEYKKDEKAYYSNAITYDKNFGYLEINEKNDKYFIEMMYNYAKIEVIVDLENIRSTIQDSITILSSIQYNNKIINNIMGDNALNFSDKEFDIFKVKKDSNFETYLEQYDKYEGVEEEKIPDLDVIE